MNNYESSAIFQLWRSFEDNLIGLPILTSFLLLDRMLQVNIDYQTLGESDDEIRILELLPQRETNGQGGPDHVRCCIEHFKQEDAPPYRTLSYVWGDPTETAQISVAYSPAPRPLDQGVQFADSDFQLVPVTVNLESALRHLSQQIHKPLRIWIDALCINQAHKREKTAQVQRMTSIYQEAEEVMVWLGPSADQSDMIMDVLEEIGREAESLLGELGGTIYEAVRKRGNENELFEENDSLFADFLTRLSGEHSTKRPFPLAAISAFISRPWWTRIWVSTLLVSTTVILLTDTGVTRSLRCATGHILLWNPKPTRAPVLLESGRLCWVLAACRKADDPSGDSKCVTVRSQLI